MAPRVLLRILGSTFIFWGVILIPVGKVLNMLALTGVGLLVVLIGMALYVAVGEP